MSPLCSAAWKLPLGGDDYRAPLSRVLSLQDCRPPLLFIRCLDTIASELLSVCSIVAGRRSASLGDFEVPPGWRDATLGFAESLPKG